METQATDEIAVAVTYRETWEDGFGARGWKLNVALDDPAAIAATATRRWRC